MRKASIGATCFVALLAGAPLLAKDPELPSTWRGGDILVDGDAADWAGAMVPVAGQPLSLGVKNDGSFLYLCIRTTDEETRKKILALGLSVWLDAGGKSDRAFGVRYPAGLRDSGDPDLPDSGDAAFQRQLDAALAGSALRILGKRDEAARMTVAEARPIEAALGGAEGELVIELKVPLAFSVDAPHAIETAPGKTIGLGLETSEPKARAGSRNGSGFGFGGRGGRRGGGSERGERNEEKAWGKPIKVWLSVPLAAAPAVARP